MDDAFNPLLGIPAFPAERYASIADRLKRLLFTTSDVVFVQAEAMLALEAVAASLARPGRTAVSIVTSPYGAFFGDWLRTGGADVVEIAAAPGQPITVPAVEAALSGIRRLDILAVVHGEAASGVVNPIEEIVALAKARGAIVVVDAVASFGAHLFRPDELGIDIAVIGPQKALGGPAGLSAVAVGPRAWEAIGEVRSPSPSSLSLAELKRSWLETGRGALPGTPPPLEFFALDAALSRVEAEGIDALVERHQLAARATRAGLRALGVPPFVEDDHAASGLVTSVGVPPGLGADTIIAGAARLGVPFGHGFGTTRGRIVRLDHTASRAAFAPVLGNVVALGLVLQGLGLDLDIGAAASAVALAYGTDAGGG